MERHRSDTWVYGPTVKLYLDDIEAIADSLAKLGTVRYSTREYTFDSLDELVRFEGKRPTMLSVIPEGRKAYFAFRRSGALGISMYAEDSDPAQAALLRIQNVLNRRTRFLARITNSRAWFAIALACLGQGLLQTAVPALRPFSVVAFPLMFFAFGVGLLGVWTRHGSFSSVNLARRHESTTFWSRNAETLVVGVLGLLLGLGATKIFNLLSSLLGSKAP